MGVYRIFISLAWPVLVLWAMVRVLRGTETWADLRQRLGFGTGQGPAPALWLHAASNGELASAESLVRMITARAPGLRIVITTNSVTGRALAGRWGIAQLSAELAPFDTRWAARRLVARHGVTGLAVLESEFYPNRLRVLADKGLPVMFLGARLSRRSARGWRRVMGLVRPVLADVSWLVPQDHGTRRRLRRLGMDPARMGPVADLKALYSAEGRAAPDAALRAVFEPDTTWLAASTHDGEDEMLLRAHLAARKAWPDLQMILAPRHPRRSGDVRRIARELGLDVAQRSAGDPPRKGAVYLADTLGEMAQFYALAGICFVGGSLVDRGGHTPFEPLAHGAAILHGPYSSNFQASYRALDSGGGAVQVADMAQIAEAIAELRDPGRRLSMLHCARDALGTAGSPAPLVDVLLRKLGAPVL